MQDYEMYDGDVKKGIINVYWDNVNSKCKSSIINSDKGIKYRIINPLEDGQKYELTFIVDNIDDLYDIVSKYISNDKDRFLEIDKIKEINNIKNIKKEQIIRLLVPVTYLKYFNKSTRDIDKNSIINSKIYFINKVCESNKLSDIKQELENIIKYFNNIISSNEYAFYEQEEKDSFAKKAIDKLNVLIRKIEDSTSYKYGKHFLVNLKIN